MTGEAGSPGASPLGRLRLLVALDALLVEGSVGGAAERMGIGAPAMSRLLKQVREIYDDPIFVRTARGLVPTPFAESLRLRLRAVAAETEDLLDPGPSGVPGGNMAPKVAGGEAIIAAPPLAMRPEFRLDEQPGPADFALRLARIGPDADPRRRLGKYIATTGGAGAIGNRPLTLEEAEDAFSVILSGEADPIQIGALFVVMHYRGVTGAELAGLVRASRSHFGGSPQGADVVELDWPAYVSPKSRAAPWFLQAARLVAQSGHKVLVHGYGEATGEKLRAAARAIGIPCCASLDIAREAVLEHGIAYVDLPAISPQIHRLVELYGLFEMRSPMNLMVHLINPLGAPASLLGVASAAQRLLHLDGAALLGWPDVGVLGSKRDVAEATPFRATTI
ncbi:LysR family transcriptional regulator, partial [Rhizobiaceae sp. 2RAB30]